MIRQSHTRARFAQKGRAGAFSRLRYRLCHAGGRAVRGECKPGCGSGAECRGRRTHCYPDQASRRRLRRERLLRPLFRDLSAGGEPARRAGLSRRGGHAAGRQPRGRALAERQSQLHQHRQRQRCGRALPPRSNASQHGRPKSRLHRRGTGLRRRQGRPLPEIHRQGNSRRGRRLWDQGPSHGLFRRQHCDRAVALRAALRDGRRGLHGHVRSLNARRTGGRRRPNQRPSTRGDNETAFDRDRRLVLHQGRSRRDHHDQRRRPGRRRVLEREGCLAHARRQEHRRPARRRAGDLGRLHGRFRLDPNQPQRYDRLQAQHALDDRRQRRRRLHPAPQLVCVFPVERQSEPRAAELDRGDRPPLRGRRHDARSGATTSTTSTISTLP